MNMGVKHRARVPGELAALSVLMMLIINIFEHLLWTWLNFLYYLI